MIIRAAEMNQHNYYKQSATVLQQIKGSEHEYENRNCSGTFH